MNRFFDIEFFSLAEFLPTALKARGGKDCDPLFILREQPLRMRSDILGGILSVEVGFVTDLASIPQIAWTIFMEPDDPRISAGAVIHDKLCDTDGDVKLEDGREVHVSHTQAAQILAYECMADLGATRFQQWGVFHAVNWFGPQWI